jgi:hypothetical protein
MYSDVIESHTIVNLFFTEALMKDIMTKNTNLYAIRKAVEEGKIVRKFVIVRKLKYWINIIYIGVCCIPALKDFGNTIDLEMALTQKLC